MSVVLSTRSSCLPFMSNVQFVRCDTRDWDQQVMMFKKAKANSPAKSCDIVIANAGVSGPDEIFASSGLEGGFRGKICRIAY